MRPIKMGIVAVWLLIYSLGCLWLANAWDPCPLDYGLLAFAAIAGIASVILIVGCVRLKTIFKAKIELAVEDSRKDENESTECE